jgi:hypothetical protein
MVPRRPLTIPASRRSGQIKTYYGAPVAASWRWICHPCGILGRLAPRAPHTSGTSILYDEFFTLDGPFSATIPIPRFAPGVLDILLFSEANVLTGGAASNTSTVSFTVTGIPEPGTVALLALGLFALAWMRVRANDPPAPHRMGSRAAEALGLESPG